LSIIRPIPWGHSSPLCHALSLLSLLLLWTSILHCHSPGVATVARRLRYSYSWLWLILVVVSTVATPCEWQCKIRTGGVRRLAVANGPNIFKLSPAYVSKTMLPRDEGGSWTAACRANAASPQPTRQLSAYSLNSTRSVSSQRPLDILADTPNMRMLRGWHEKTASVEFNLI